MVQFTPSYFSPRSGFVINQLSGAGCRHMGNFPTLPLRGELAVSPGRMFDCRVDVAPGRGHAGWYETHVQDSVRAQLTVTCRTGMARYDFPASDSLGTVIIGTGVAATAITQAAVSVTGPRSCEGYAEGGEFCGIRTPYKVYFVAEFDTDALRSGIWERERLTPGGRFAEGGESGVYFVFDLRHGRTVHYRIGISYVSVENARANLRAENPGWDFDAVRRAAQDEWNEWLGRIEVKGGTQQQRTKFYTDLWHVLLGRHKIDDVNGEYPDLTDGQRAGSFTRDIRVKTRTLPRDAAGRVVHHMYNSDAFWLTQWNLNVLWGLGWPEMPDEMSASLIRYADNGGLIPRGPCAGGYTYIMSGCPATPLIVSAYNLSLIHI